MSIVLKNSADLNTKELSQEEQQRKGEFEQIFRLLRYSEYRANSMAKQLKQLSRSRSWQVTEPLRKTNFAIKDLQRATKGLLQGAQGDKYHKDAIELIKESGLFNVHYYEEQLQARGLKVEDKLSHFLQSGWKEGLNPNPFFDCSYYCAQIKQVGHQVKVNPLVHYLLEDTSEKVRTSRFFDPATYAALYPDVLEHEMDPLSHFLHIGILEGRLADKSMCELEKWRASIEPSYDNIFQPRQAGTPEPYDFIFCVHVANLSGAPMLGLAVLKSFFEKGYNCLTIIIREGELEEEFNKYSDVIHLSRAPEHFQSLSNQLDFLDVQSLLSKNPIVLLNSAENHRIAPVLGRKGLRTVSLIQECTSAYPAYVHKELIRNTDIFVFSSEYTKSDAHWLSDYDLPFKLLPQGLIDDEFASLDKQESRAAICHRYGINPRAFLVLACASIENRKGTDLFVRAALQTYAQMGREADIHFIWVGEELNPENDFLKWALVDCEKAGILDRVHFTGAQSEIKPFFGAADMFVLPSRQDPLPCVLHMAMAAKLPVVAFKNSGGAEEVLQNGGGKLVEYGRVEQMAEAVISYYKNPATLEKDGQKGHDLVIENFNLESYVQELLSIARSLEGEEQKGGD